jgi:hypothetical protein
MGTATSAHLHSENAGYPDAFNSGLSSGYSGKHPWGMSHSQQPHHIASVQASAYLDKAPGGAQGVDPMSHAYRVESLPYKDKGRGEGGSYSSWGRDSEKGKKGDYYEPGVSSWGRDGETGRMGLYRQQREQMEPGRVPFGRDRQLLQPPSQRELDVDGELGMEEDEHARGSGMTVGCWLVVCAARGGV